jgi:hypothetical protein
MVRILSELGPRISLNRVQKLEESDASIIMYDYLYYIRSRIHDDCLSIVLLSLRYSCPHPVFETVFQPNTTCLRISGRRVSGAQMASVDGNV